jgi:hypothetical protein
MCRFSFQFFSNFFSARLALFGQLFYLLHGPNIGGQMDLHVRIEIVFALKLCRALIATKVLVVCVRTSM